MKKTKFIILSLITIIFCTCFTACSTDIGKEEERAYTSNLIETLNDLIGMPNIQNGFMKKSLKSIYELQDNAELICYAYSRNEYTGLYTYLYPCIGFGIPYSTQYTAPEAIYKYYGEYGMAPQADPDGLYHGDGTQATWVLRVSETGEVIVVYAEENMHIEQQKLPRRLCDEKTLPADY
jgi:hypothetical protein